MRQNRDSLVPIHSSRGWPNATASLFLPPGDGFLTVQQESNEPVLSKLLKHPWMAFGMGVPAQYQPGLQRPGPVLVGAAAEPAIELLLETPRRSSGLRWRSAGGANKGLLVGSSRQYLDATRPKESRYFETARNWRRRQRALAALRRYRSSWICVALRFCSASQVQSRRYRQSCRWTLI